MKSFKNYLSEGLNDPGIFKAVFLAGGPGSGKSFIATSNSKGHLGLLAMGLRVSNIDTAYENLLKKAGMSTTPEDIWSDKGQELRLKALALTDKQKEIYIKGRLGIIIDGTGKDYDKIITQKKMFDKLGYDTAMVFVNTNLETAIQRDKDRDRTIGAENVTKMWQGVQDNLGKYQSAFKNNFIIVDNSEGKDWKRDAQRGFKDLAKLAKKPVSNTVGKNWLKQAAAEKGAPAQPRKSG